MCSQLSSPDPDFLARLPNRSRLELGAYETAPRTAHGHIARVLEEWSLPEFGDVAALIGSELAPGPRFSPGDPDKSELCTPGSRRLGDLW
jgi:hypothetical protein